MLKIGDLKKNASIREKKMGTSYSQGKVSSYSQGRELFTGEIEGFTRYLKAKHYQPVTVKYYVERVVLFLDWMGERNLTAFTALAREDVEAYQREILESPKKYSMHTVHHRMKVVRRFFEYLVESSQLLASPIEELVLPPLGKRIPKNVLTEAEMKKVLNVPHPSTKVGLRDRALLELLYSSALRRSECVRLTIHDIDTKGGYLRVNQGKGRKDRIVPVGRKACRLVREYMKKVRPHHLKDDSEERALFMGIYGKPLTANNLVGLVKKYGRKAGIGKPVTVHGIRRSAATHMLRAGAHPLYVQKFLGHKRSETVNSYIEATGLDLKKTHKKAHPRG